MTSSEDGHEVTHCLQEQLSELETLAAIYSKEELVFDSDCSPFILSYLERPLDTEDAIVAITDSLNNADLSLGFTLKLLLNSHPVEMKCDLPRTYPHKSAPCLLVRTSSIISKQKHSGFRKSMSDYIETLDRGEPILFTILDWISEHLSLWMDTQEDVSEVEEKDSPCSFTRMWLYSHHIYSKFKRRDIIAWADELRLHGFSMCGKPGIICVEGHTGDVEDYWARLRRLNWKRLVMKEREDTACDSLKQLKELHRFGIFREMVFGEGKGGAGGFHSDIGLLRQYLHEHECSYMFEIYFGIDGCITDP
ncbi:RWD domain-containing protein 2B-like isoform X2 [Watersipora subatra]|uniref:RWD domain-containing protein 2B-like isoform X2 n=1 Tax=Watersipora subatra TaxID=2589382 RepID=UPI00355B6AF9